MGVGSLDGGVEEDMREPPRAKRSGCRSLGELLLIAMGIAMVFGLVFYSVNRLLVGEFWQTAVMVFLGLAVGLWLARRQKLKHGDE